MKSMPLPRTRIIQAPRADSPLKPCTIITPCCDEEDDHTQILDNETEIVIDESLEDPAELLEGAKKSILSKSIFLTDIINCGKI